MPFAWFLPTQLNSELVAGEFHQRGLWQWEYQMLLTEEVMSVFLSVISPWRPCTFANPQQGPLVGKTVHLQRTWGGRGVKGRGRWETEWAAHNKGGHSLSEHVRPVVLATLIQQAALLPWQEACWLHYNWCPVIKLWSQNFLMNEGFFQIRPYFPTYLK